MQRPRSRQPVWAIREYKLKRLKALCDLWIAVIWDGKQTSISVSKGADRPLDWLQPFEGGQFYKVGKGGQVIFDNVAEGENPCKMLIEQYPNCFVMDD